MNSAMQSFFYVICAVGIGAFFALICSGVKFVCRKILKRGEMYDDQ